MGCLLHGVLSPLPLGLGGRQLDPISPYSPTFLSAFKHITSPERCTPNRQYMKWLGVIISLVRRNKIKSQVLEGRKKEKHFSTEGLQGDRWRLRARLEAQLLEAFFKGWPTVLISLGLRGFWRHTKVLGKLEWLVILAFSATELLESDIGRGRISGKGLSGPGEAAALATPRLGFDSLLCHLLQCDLPFLEALLTSPASTGSFPYYMRWHLSWTDTRLPRRCPILFLLFLSSLPPHS